MKSNEEIAAIIMKRVNLIIKQELPEPTCPIARMKWLYKVEELRKKLSKQLYAGEMGIKIDITV